MNFLLILDRILQFNLRNHGNVKFTSKLTQKEGSNFYSVGQVKSFDERKKFF